MEQKTLLVLGASSEVGRKLIEAVYEDYGLIYAHYAHGDGKLKELKDRIGGKLHLIQDDFSSSDAGNAVIEAIDKNGIWPEHVVHLPSAKVTNVRFTKVKYEEVEQYLNVGLRSAITVSQAVFKRLVKEEREGKEICVLSSYVNGIPPKFMLPYVTSKYAMLGYVRALSAEYADKGIMVNAVSPGMMETEFLTNIFDHAIEDNAAKSPLGRNLYVDEVIPTIKFLLSDGADRITGQNIVVSGGM